MERYVYSARVLHWLMALCFLFMWVSGFAMASLVPEDTVLEEQLIGLHISMGVTLLFLLVLRIGIRLFNKPPVLPEEFPAWERVGAHLGHLALYLLPAATILIGWAETDFGGHGVHWFGLAMPKIFPTMEFLLGINVENATELLHELFSYAMLIVAVVHVAAVLKHKYYDGHDVMSRMTFR
ncbi:cytochrome b [Roseibium album]|uniref:cytochrome b n=1 Tax=Roseibium album TaxID=311410 RepID=UPI0018C957D8|nr:cytochrome b [Roseibium album]MBG6207013.1 cytochrome b561 [Labrenzia sp. EL_126]